MPSTTPTPVATPPWISVMSDPVAGETRLLLGYSADDRPVNTFHLPPTPASGPTPSENPLTGSWSPPWARGPARLWLQTERRRAGAGRGRQAGVALLSITLDSKEAEQRRLFVAAGMAMALIGLDSWGRPRSRVHAQHGGRHRMSHLQQPHAPGYFVVDHAERRHHLHDVSHAWGRDTCDPQPASGIGRYSISGPTPSAGTFPATSLDSQF